VEIVAGDRRRDRLLLGGLLVLTGVLWLGLGLPYDGVGWAALAAGGLAAWAASRVRTSRPPPARQHGIQ
jgi:hypothetical protein